MGVQTVRDALTSGYVKRLLRVKAGQLKRRPEFRRTGRSDIEQDLVVYVMKKAHLFDPDRASVRTFISRVVDSAVAIMIRGARREKRAAGLTAWSLDGTVFKHDEDVTPLAELITGADVSRRLGLQPLSAQQRCDLEADVGAVVKDLSPALKAILARRLDGSEASVARDLGTSRRQVRKAMARIREHFRAAGFSDEPGFSGQPARRGHR